MPFSQIPYKINSIKETKDNETDNKGLSFRKQVSFNCLAISNSHRITRLLRELERKRLNPLIHLAAQNGELDTVKSLLEQGAEVNSKDNSGGTPLYWAAKNGHGDIVNVLLQNNAEVNSKDNSGGTPLHWAAQNGYDAIVNVLLQNNAEVNSKDNNNHTPLHSACFEGQVNIVPILLEKGAEVNAKDNAGNTPLHSACFVDKVNIVPILLENGAEVNAKNNNKCTPLHSACFGDAVNVVPILLENGAEVNAKDDREATPLHFACFRGAVNIVPILLEKGAEVNAKDNAGSTPLHVAAQYGHGQGAIVPILLEKGAEVNAKDNAGSTPLYSACFHGSLKTAQSLLKREDEVNTPFSAQNKYSDIATTLIKNYEDTLNLNDFDSNDEDNFNLNDFDSKHALYCYNRTRYFEMLQLLIKHGATINFQNDMGEKTIYSACQTFHNGQLVCELDDYVDIINLFIKEGVRIKELENTDKTNFHMISNYFLKIAMNNNIHKKEVMNNIELFIRKQIALYPKKYSNNPNLTKDALTQDFTEIIEILKTHIQTDFSIDPMNIPLMSITTTMILLIIMEKNQSNWTDTENNTLFHYLCSKAALTSLWILLSKNIEWGVQQNKEKQTPLHCLYNFLTVTHTYYTEDTTNPRYKRLKTKILRIMTLMLDTGFPLVNVRNDNPNPLLSWVCGKKIMMKSFLTNAIQKFRLNAQDKYGETVLHKACTWNDMEIVKLLVEKGVPLNVQDKNGETVLHKACAWSDMEIVTLLVKNGATLNAQDKNGETVLHKACAWDNMETVKLKFLVENGVPLNAQDKNGETVLHKACTWNNMEIVKLLVENGAQWNIKNKQGNTPFQIAHQNECVSIENYLTEAIKMSEQKYQAQGTLHQESLILEKSH